jgi:pimeloyl-ACP methyl ester carboxylesterase
MSISHRDIEANGLRFHLAECGPADGPPVLLLHGFPEYWGAWKVHMVQLAAQGFRVIAPDLRGYGTSAKPARVRDYALDLLVEDVTGMLDALDLDSAHIVGHDWGGALAWQVARAAPERIKRLVVINCPPFDSLRAVVLKDPIQVLRSWYVMSFQFPLLPQWGLGIWGHWMPCKMMIDSALPGTFTQEGLAGHRAAWSEPEALRSMIHWYRAAIRHPPTPGQRITTPSLLLWGEQDRFLGTALIPLIESLCDELTVTRFPENTHWLPHEAPEAVVEAIASFIGRPTSAADDMIASPPEAPE